MHIIDSKEGDNIKNFIEYYYNFKNIYLINKENEYIFRENDNIYQFIPLTRDFDEINEINGFINHNQQYDQLIKNIYDQIVTNYYGKNFILLKKKLDKTDENILTIISNNNYVLINKVKYKIDRTDWIGLWSKKVDNLEYQLNHILNKYPIISESINYYIGMAENAISYISNYLKINTINEKCVISHIRIQKHNINNPQNIIIDYQSRDIAEYFKYIFFNDKYSYSQIKNILLNLKKNNISYELLYGRLLFPTFYFDLYDKVVNSNFGDNILLKVINRVEEYEQYLFNIFVIINEIQKIPRINWI